MKKTFLKKVIDKSNVLETQYIEKIRTKDKDFTRCRKLTLQDVYLQMIANKGKSQKNEVENFFQDIRKDMNISATAFFNARMKFNPEALLAIMQDLLKETYETAEEIITLNGYHVLAVDGSDIILPLTEENINKYGQASSAKQNRMPTMASISTIYDCINKLILDVQINPYKYAETSSAKEHLNTAKSVLPREAKSVCIFDRGYPSIRLIDQMINNDQCFLIRLRSCDFKEATSKLAEQNSQIWHDLTYDRLRTNAYREDKRFRQKLLNTTYHLRFVRLSLCKSNEENFQEYLVTNLKECEFDLSAIKELYNLRWGIETCYRSMKSQMNMEDFSGYRDILVRQDIYACAFIYNIISMTIAESEKVQSKAADRYLYEMKINRNHALGVLKRSFLEMYVLYRDKKAIRMAQKKFEESILKHSCPVRKERQFSRDMTVINKSRISYRRSY